MTDPAHSLLDRARAAAQARLTAAEQDRDKVLTDQRNAQQARVQAARQQAEDTITQAKPTCRLRRRSPRRR